MTKKVAIISGLARLKKYNAHLGGLYQDIGYEANEFQFNRMKLFCCHMHTQLDDDIKNIIDNHDVIHCQSSAFFRLLPYADEKGLIASKPIVLESPVLKSHTGTLYAALNWSDHYRNTPQSRVVNGLLNTFCFTQKFQEETRNILERHVASNQVLSLTSAMDGVTDNEGLEETHFQRIFDTGKHARLFAPQANEREFSLVEQFLVARQV